MENEIITKQAVWVLNLQHMNPFFRQFHEFYFDAFTFTGFYRSIDGSAVDDHASVFINVMTTELHSVAPFIEEWESLMPALGVNVPLGPESRLRVLLIVIVGQSRSECAYERALKSSFDKLLASLAKEATRTKVF